MIVKMLMFLVVTDDFTKYTQAYVTQNRLP